jgi:hypothetical protein
MSTTAHEKQTRESPSRIARPRPFSSAESSTTGVPAAPGQLSPQTAQAFREDRLAGRSHRKLQKAADNSQQAMQLRSLQHTADISRHSKQVTQFHPVPGSTFGSAVVQRMPDEEVAIFIKKAKEIGDQLFTGYNHFKFIYSAQRIAERPDITMAAAAKELEVQGKNLIADELRVELDEAIDDLIDQGASKSMISETVAGLFSTNVHEVTERYVAPFRDANGKLPEGLHEAVLSCANVGARSVMPVLTDQAAVSLLEGEPNKLAFMDRLDVYISANLNFSKYYGDQKKELGNVIHFIWSGRPISKGALANILKWSEKAADTSWQVIMWTDSKISDWVKAKPLLDRGGIKLFNVTAIIDPRFKAAYEFAREHNLAGASDLIRLSLLNKFGGAYVDVDIGPGDVNLHTFKSPGTLERPQLAPGIRDAGGVRDLLKLAPNEPISDAHVKKAEKILRLAGTANNNFITAAPGGVAMNPLINKIAKSANSLGEGGWKDAGGFIAGITGPMMIGGVLDQMTNKRQLEQSPSVTDQSLQWLTPESEDQDWHK